MTDLFIKESDDLNESNLTLVNENNFKNELANNSAGSILTLEHNSTFLNRPATISWNKITIRSPEKIGFIEKITRRKSYQFEIQKALINSGI
jgi:hypothetical protein